jgi:hypothetical protein
MMKNNTYLESKRRIMENNTYQESKDHHVRHEGTPLPPLYKEKKRQGGQHHRNHISEIAYHTITFLVHTSSHKCLVRVVEGWVRWCMWWIEGGEGRTSMQHNKI